MNQAVALLHSFWFPEARQAFAGHRRQGSGLRDGALGHRPHATGATRSAACGRPRRSPPARRPSTRRRPPGTPTRREKGYIDAVAGLFSSADVTTQRARDRRLRSRRWAQVAKDNPGDIEARIFWALAVAQTATPTDKTYAANLRAAEILEPLFKKMPGHPGLAHYIIHAYDAPPLAPRALVAARRYASIAPAVPHALHMPSHTFTRVGSWKESIDTNRKSAEAARKAGGPAGAGEELHALDYQTYAYLQLADDAAAKAVRDHAMTLPRSRSTAPAAWRRAPARLRSRPFRRATRSSARPGAKPRR